IGKKSKSQSPRHAETAIVCRAATQTNNDFFRIALARIQNHFAHAERSRTNWIAFTFGKSPHASRFAHLHYCKFFLVDPSVARVDLATKRIVRLAFEPGTTARITHCFRCPLPTVGHWHHFDLRVRQHIEQPFRDVFRGVPRVKCAFEFIGSNKNSHSYSFTRSASTVILSRVEGSRSVTQ